jgi:hypothetical protein
MAYTDQLDTVNIVRWVPIIGELQISGDVPKLLTVPTDKAMIFGILHDPPGGLSSASLAEGSEITFHLSLDTHQASSTSGGCTHAYGGGFDPNFELLAAPFGIGIDQETLSGGVSIDHSKQNSNSSSEGTGNAKGWAMTLTVNKAISTSGDPTTAGAASDLIIGGGLEIGFEEIMMVYNEPAHDNQEVCLQSRVITAWMPAKLTTFVLPVYDVLDMAIRTKSKQEKLKADANEASADAGAATPTPADAHSPTMPPTYPVADLEKQQETLDFDFENWVHIYQQYVASTGAEPESGYVTISGAPNGTFVKEKFSAHSLGFKSQQVPLDLNFSGTGDQRVAHLEKATFNEYTVQSADVQKLGEDKTCKIEIKTFNLPGSLNKDPEKVIQQDCVNAIQHEPECEGTMAWGEAIYVKDGFRDPGRLKARVYGPFCSCCKQGDEGKAERKLVDITDPVTGG